MQIRTSWASGAFLHECNEFCAFTRSCDQHGERGILPYVVRIVQPLTRIHGECQPSVGLKVSRCGDRRTQRSAHAEEDDRCVATCGDFAPITKLATNFIIAQVGSDEFAQFRRLLTALIFKDLGAIHREEFVCGFDPCYPSRLMLDFRHVDPRPSHASRIEGIIWQSASMEESFAR